MPPARAVGFKDGDQLGCATWRWQGAVRTRRIRATKEERAAKGFWDVYAGQPESSIPGAGIESVAKHMMGILYILCRWRTIGGCRLGDEIQVAAGCRSENEAFRTPVSARPAWVKAKGDEMRKGVIQRLLLVRPRASRPNCYFALSTMSTTRINVNTNKGFQARLITTVASDTTACELLIRSAIPRQTPAFAERLSILESRLVDHFRGPQWATNMVSAFLHWCKKAGSVPKALKGAINHRKALRRSFRKQKLRFICEAGLAASPSERAEFLGQIPTAKIAPLPTAYPPVGHWTRETDSIGNKWDYHMRFGYQPDKRMKRHEIHELIPENLQRDILEDESLLVKDPQGKCALLVVRDFCPVQSALQFVDDAVKEATACRRSIRVSKL
ncbi:hypothetical protein FPV67DRAFT_1459720 [Lyophyllum atratum]|nr:hypothetical protein FPV67DRAFT_1459720 [Lyophyllum atratum]